MAMASNAVVHAVATASTAAAEHTPYPTTPAFSDDLEWATAYLAVHMNSIPSRRYTYLLWVAVCLGYLIFAVLHWTRSRAGVLGAYWTKWSLRRRTWRKKHKIALAAKKGRPHQQPVPLPSNSQLIGLAVVTIVSLVLCFVGPDYISPSNKVWQFHRRDVARVVKRGYDAMDFIQYAPQYTIQKAWWTSSNRTGLIAFALMPLCILFVLKAPPFAIFAIPFMIQIHFDKLIWLHRWIGRLIWFITALHVAFWSVELAQERRPSNGVIVYNYAWHYQKFLYGWIAFGLLTLLIVLSLRPIRRHFYETFYFLHVLLVPAMLVFSALHHPYVGWWCWAALFLWIGERIWRGTWWIYINGIFGKAPPQASHITPFPPSPQGTSGFGQDPEAGSSQQTLVDSMRFRLPAPPPTHPPAHLAAVAAQQRAQQPGMLNNTYPPAQPKLGASAASALPPAYTYIPPAGFGHAELLAGRTVRLRFITPGFMPWAPGQHFLINMPSISRFTSHPFTGASVCDEQAPGEEGREVVLIIRAKDGWTKDLWDTVVRLSAQGKRSHPKERVPKHTQLPSTGVIMRVYVDGAYGSAARARWGDHSTAVIVAGGSGVSFGLSILEYLCFCLAGRDERYLGGRAGRWGKSKFKVNRVRFVWLVREFSHIQWAASVLRRCVAMVPPPMLQVDIFVSNTKTMSGIGEAPRIGRAPTRKAVQFDQLAPPSPAFGREHRRSASADSTASHDSTDSYVDLSYYGLDEEQEVGGDEIHPLDLTNFDGDNDDILPGEAQLSDQVKFEGKRRRRQSKMINMAITAKHDLDERAAEYRRKARGGHNRISATSTDKLLSPMGASPLSSALEDEEEAGSSPYAFKRPSGSHDPSSYSSQPPSAHPLMGPTSASLDGMSHDLMDDGFRSASPSSNPNFDARSDRSIYDLMPHTGTGAHGEETRLEVEPNEAQDIAVMAEYARPGRPKLERIMSDEVEASRGSIIVGCCGPTALNAVVRKVIAANINPARVARGDMRGSITLASEDFDY